MARGSVENSESTIEVAVPVVTPIVEVKIEAPVVNSTLCGIISTVDYPTTLIYGGQPIVVSPRAKLTNLDRNLIPTNLSKGLRVLV